MPQLPEGQSQKPLPDGSLQQLAAQKEKEWRELLELRAQSLQAAFDEKDKQLNEEKSRFAKLKEDFKYNLKLLGERDQELERYDAMFAEMKAAFQSRDAEVSELKIEIDQLQKTASLEDQARDELQIHYQQRLREKQNEIEQYRVSKEAELQKEREALEGIKRSLQRQLRETEDELDIQRRELTAGFDEAMRRREHEMRTQLNEMSSAVLAYEMKVKLLSKELDLVRSASQKTTDQLTTADQSTRDLEKKLKQKEWELNDLRGMKDARIAELEEQAHQLQLSVDRAMEDFQRKHKTLDRYAREKETVLLAAKESHAEAERKLQERIRELQSSIEAGDVERRKQEWEHQDAIKEKDLLLEKLQHEIEDVRDHSNVQLAKASQDTVGKDVEIQTLREAEGKLKAELAQKNEDLSRYKKELSLAIEREASLERSKTQAELDWQRRCEDMERGQYEKSEHLIEKLTKARDESLASLKECKRELSQRDDLIRVLSRDHDHAMATLRRNNLHVDKGILPSKDSAEDQELSASHQIQALQEQNETLKSVIHQMRQDMEQLGNQLPSETQGERSKGTGPKEHSPISEEYVKVLEKESRDLKVKIRQLEERLETDKQRQGHSIVPEGVASGAGTIPAGVDNAYLKSHIQSLHDTIGAQRAEKMSVVAQLKKQQARITHLEGMLSHIQQQPREKQSEIDQLQYELTTQSRRHATEAAGLRQRIAELELNLAETRREADEYFKGGLQTNLEATALGNQLSALKMDLASRRPHGNATQSALVRQLQEEVHLLRRQLVSRGQPYQRTDDSHDTGRHTSELYAKLKSAARHIGQLARERQQLIEMGNRLRSELARYTGKPTGGNSANNPWDIDVAMKEVPGKRDGGLGTGKRSSAGELANQFSNKLNKLEKLQYALTKKELQFAQQRLEQDHADTDIIQVQLSSGSSSESQPELTKQPVIKVSHPLQNWSAPAEEVYTHPSHEAQQSKTRSSTSSQESTSQQAPLMMSSSSLANRMVTPLMMSSYGEESLKDVWRLLDEGQSPIMHSPSPRVADYDQVPDHEFARVPSMPDANQTNDVQSKEFQVVGASSQIGMKPAPQKPQMSSEAAEKPQKKKVVTKPKKIRNWNDRDDGGDIR